MSKEQVRSKRVRRKRLLPIGLNTCEGARYLGISQAMMRKMRGDGSGPSYRKIGRKVIYLRRDLQAWLESKSAF